MKTTLEKSYTVLPAIITFIIASIILFSAIRHDSGSSWVRSEFYITIISHILFFLALSSYVYFNLQSKHWGQRYLGNAGVLTSIGFYFYSSLFYDPSFPTLGILSLITIIYIIPSLLINQLAITLIKKYSKNNF